MHAHREVAGDGGRWHTCRPHEKVRSAAWPKSPAGRSAERCDGPADFRYEWAAEEREQRAESLAALRRCAVWSLRTAVLWRPPRIPLWFPLAPGPSGLPFTAEAEAPLFTAEAEAPLFTAEAEAALFTAEAAHPKREPAEDARVQADDETGCGAEGAGGGCGRPLCGRRLKSARLSDADQTDALAPGE